MDGQVVVNLKGWHGSPNDLDILGQIPRVSVLCVDAFGSRLRDSDVERIAGIPSLKVIDLSKTEITAAAIGHLRRATDLRELWLFGTQITDADLAAIGGLNRLWTLGLERTRSYRTTCLRTSKR